ncbi:DHA2 family multidrug resistance protein-like MFS transporter [Microbacterium sp. AG790]|uniref:MFS transporter n=1 Tax=Microbacterium sp. AG790 TaxID=2183995 RepID=UPI000EAE7F95|nr:MFS transporter [Microbacterium sp. AG790]RKS94398.1 DHA2 family multidrug resistance protein-like MFS transporter [Microbacterium sp. AG790]
MSDVDRSPHDGNAPSAREAGRVLATVCGALALISIDVTVLHVAAPTIAQQLHADDAQLLWIIDVFPFVIAPLLLSAGVLSDRYGRRLFLMAGMGVFVAGSAFAAFASTPAALIAARVVMAVGAAAVLPPTMSLLRVAYPDRARRVRAVAIWSMSSAAAAAAGPVIGGIIVEHSWWGGVFLINVPLGALVLLAAAFWVSESRSDRPGSTDLRSQGLAIVAVLTAAVAANSLAEHHLDVFVVGMVVAVASGWVFVDRQQRLRRRGEQPTLDVALFRNATFSAGLAAVAVAMFAIVGLELQFARYLQLERGLTPLHAAIALVPLAVATIAGAFVSPRVLRRWGHRSTVTGTFVLAGLALAGLAFSREPVDLAVFAAATALAGLSIEISAVAANDLIISSAGVHEVGGAAALEEISYDLGGGFGTAVLGAVAVTASDGFHAAVMTSAVLLVGAGVGAAWLLRPRGAAPGARG